MGMALSTAQLTSAPQYGMPGTNFSHLINMSLASDYPESSSGIHEKWFKFQALSNAVRIEVVGAASNDDNSIRMFADPGVIYSAPLAVLVEENDVNFLTVGVVDQGNEILLTDVLTEGQWYYVCITTLNGTPGNVTVKFNSLLPSTCDVGPFTSYTGIYTNACQTFKCQYRTQARRAIINKWSGMAQVGFPISTYTIPAPTSLITTCQLSKITPVNMSGANQTIFISADLEYNLQDAAGNMNVLFARQSSNCSFQLSSEATSNVRSTDECPVYKSYASSIATDRTICGASQYQWEFSMVYPSPGLPVFASGASNSRILALASIPGMANGQRYDVRIRSLYSDATTYSNWSGMADCVRTIGAAGISPLEWGGLKVSDHEHITLYPNPTRFQNQIVVTWQDEVFSSIEIYNAQGQKVSNYQGKDLVNNKLEIEASFAVGLYHVVFIGSNETIALQWMIE
jgi:hypothetical protein